MRKIIRFLGKLIKVVVVFVVLFVVVSFAFHQYQLSKEAHLFVPNGQLVEVNGHQMHVYSKGEGTQTLVFMSGGGTSSPVLDFKSLYSLLSPHYRIVVVEKIGYGFSDVGKVERHLPSILADTRSALDMANIQGPFVLVPHSMSGIEALYWSQQYPDEVQAIVGLDMSVPQSYETYEPNTFFLHLSSFAAQAGITRWFPSLADSEAIKYGTLTEHEKEVYRAVFYRRTATATMLNEAKAVKDNASKIDMNTPLETPIILFASNGENTGWSSEAWRGFQQNFIERAKNGKIVPLDVGHYVHNHSPEIIKTEIIKFLSELDE